MRISCLLVVFLCGLVSVSGASDRLQQGSSLPTAATSYNSDLFDGRAGIVRPDFAGLAASDRAYRNLDAERDGDVTCYTIESYLVKRQSPDSDVIRPIGHSTCQRASKYGVKKAEAADKASSR